MISAGTAMLGSAAITGVGSYFAAKKKAEMDRRSARESFAMNIAKMEMAMEQNRMNAIRAEGKNMQNVYERSIMPKYRA